MNQLIIQATNKYSGTYSRYGTFINRQNIATGRLVTALQSTNEQALVSKHCSSTRRKRKKFFEALRETGRKRRLVFSWESVGQDLLLSLKGDELQRLSRLPGLQASHDLLCIYAPMILDPACGGDICRGRREGVEHGAFR
jgi:hypothetical protein